MDVAAGWGRGLVWLRVSPRKRARCLREPILPQLPSGERSRRGSGGPANKYNIGSPSAFPSRSFGFYRDVIKRETKSH